MTQASGKPLEYDQKWTGHFKQALQKMHNRYNPDNRLLKCPFSSPGYHTTIKQADFVHPFLQAVNYALALLDDQDPAYQQRAYDILQTVIEHQDQNPESATYGIWSWFWEEPLEQMSPPDWNWADFVGKRLVLILSSHQARLPAELRVKAEEALAHSCEAIIRRNVGPEYTNIAIMGAFVTLVGGEVLGNPRFKAYGVKRLQRLHEYTMKTRSFLEYNSPTYGSVCLIELSGLVRYMQDEEARKLAKELLEVTWTMVAEHFQPSVMQWSGPHARSYEKFSSPERLSFLYMALQGRLPLISDEEFIYNTEWYGNEIHCPEHLFPLFNVADTRELQAELPATNEFKLRTAYTYMTPSWSLGSFNHGIMWNQTRNLLAFLGDSPQDSFYARLRVLHDGYDYCSAIYAGQQRRGEALFGICFALDGGDTHPNLDFCHGKITAADLRVRLEIGAKGQAPLIAIAEDGTARAEFPGTGLAVRLELAAAKWSGGPVRLEAVEEQGIWAIDAVLYSGEAKLIDFHAMEEAACLFHLSLGEADQLAAGPDVQWRQEEGDIIVALGAGADALHVRLPVKPADKQDIFHKLAL